MKRQLFTLFCMVLLLSHGAFAISYRLLDDHYLDVGNRWEYQFHISESPFDGNVNWTATGVNEVLKKESVSGYITSLARMTTSGSHTGTTWSTINCFMTDDYFKEIREEDEDIVYTLRNNNPFESLPIWVNETDNNRSVGHGQYYGYMAEYNYSWSNSQNSYITFLRTETVTVPAGTFDCVVVMLRSEFYEFEGMWGYTDKTLWFNPAVGDVKSIEDYWAWDPFEEVELTGYGTSELVSTNVSYRQDFDGDYDVDMNDLAILSAAWLTLPGQQGWNGDCDLNYDNIINISDIAEFVEYWLIG